MGISREASETTFSITIIQNCQEVRTELLVESLLTQEGNQTLPKASVEVFYAILWPNALFHIMYYVFMLYST